MSISAPALTSASVRQYALDCGADDVGIASMDRFDGAPPEMDPRRIFPAAKSCIGLVFRIARGYIRGIEEGTHFFQYPSMGYGGINEIYAPTVLYELGRFIEDHGYEAAVYRNTGGRGSVSDMTGRPEHTESPELHGGWAQRALIHTKSARPGQPAPDVQIHFRIAAFLCGLGEIGLSKMFLSRAFGPLNRQAFILTDAELEPDPLVEAGRLCNHCGACVAQCPGRCLSKTGRVQVTLAGRPVEWAELDEWSCFAYYEGAARKSNPFLPADAYRAMATGDAILRGEHAVTRDEFNPVHHAVMATYPNEPGGYNPPKCGGCLRACIAAMERRGVLPTAFATPFRTQAPWRAD